MSMKGKLLEFPVTAELPIYKKEPILPYADAAAVRADLDLLSEDEAKAIFAEVNGARTSGALTRYDADGQLVPSGLVDNGSQLGAARRIVFTAPANESGFTGLSSPATDYLRLSTATANGVLQIMTGGIVRGFWNSAGLSIGNDNQPAARRLEVRDAIAAQQRWSYSDTVYGERQVAADGEMIDSSTGNFYRWIGPGSAQIVFDLRSGNKISCTGGNLQLQHSAITKIQLEVPGVRIYSGLGLYGSTPVAQCTPISDPTDEATTQAALISLLTYLRSRGDIAT